MRYNPYHAIHHNPMHYGSDTQEQKDQRGAYVYEPGTFTSLALSVAIIVLIWKDNKREKEKRR